MKQITILKNKVLHRNIGKWIYMQSKEWAGGEYYKCSICGYGYSTEWYHEPNEFRYCPNCGAKMKIT